MECFKLRFSILLSLIIFIFYTSSYSQKISNSYVSDSIQFWSIVNEHKAVLYKNPDSALLILQKGTKFIEKPLNIKLKASYLLYKGNIFRIKNQVTVAFPYFNEAYGLFSSLGDKKNCNQ